MRHSVRVPVRRPRPHIRIYNLNLPLLFSFVHYRIHVRYRPTVYTVHSTQLMGIRGIRFWKNIIFIIPYAY